MRFYFYKLTVDDGGAPCVQDDVLSLAICKPMIRSTAERGDWIFGFAANSLHRDNVLVYAARVTEKVRDGAYFRAAKFSRRRDCVYERRGDRFAWRLGSLYHGSENVRNDLGTYPAYKKANVLLSADFRYFGRSGTAGYKRSYPLIAQAVERLGQGHRVRHREELRTQFEALRQRLWARPRLIVVRPFTAPRSGACHRDAVCGVTS